MSDTEKVPPVPSSPPRLDALARFAKDVRTLVAAIAALCVACSIVIYRYKAQADELVTHGERLTTLETHDRAAELERREQHVDMHWIMRELNDQREARGLKRRPVPDERSDGGVGIGDVE